MDDDYEEARFAAGHEPPLAARNDRAVERRAVSMRSFAGVALAGVTAAVLLAPALGTAARPPIPVATWIDGGIGAADPVQGFLQLGRAPRLSVFDRAVAARDNRRMQVPAVVAEGDHDLVHNVPFRLVKLDLAAAPETIGTYPPLDSFDAVLDDDEAPAARSVLIYGEKIDAKVSLRLSAFPQATAFGPADAMTDEQAESQARSAEAAILSAMPIISAAAAIDPVRFGKEIVAAVAPVAVARRARVIAENMTVTSASAVAARPRFSEKILALADGGDIGETLRAAGFDRVRADAAAPVLAALVKSGADRLRIGFESGDLGPQLVSVSAYDAQRHLATVALEDSGAFVQSPEPSTNPALATARRQPARSTRATTAQAPAAYDAVNRAAIAYALPKNITRQIVRLLSSTVDLRAPLAARDRLELFFSDPDFKASATREPQLYFARFAFGTAYGSLYRYETRDGQVDYYGPEGRSKRALLLRKPLAKGIFQSGFGMRMHPILGGMRMHSGVDWSARTGSPIVASGSGIVESAGWRGDFGRQTVIRHANGYETSYAHQSVIMPGVVPGAFVAQGQVIGLVGASGLATGPHLHYEVSINGNKVDPLRVHLPEGKTLRGDELEAFLTERDRIDALLYDRRDNLFTLASNGK